MVEWILTHGDRITAFVLLLGIAGGAGLALYNEWIVMGKSHKRELADKDRQISNLEREREKLVLANERLVEKLSRALEVAEVGMAAAVRKTEGRTRSIRLPEDDERRES